MRINHKKYIDAALVLEDHRAYHIEDVKRANNYCIAFLDGYEYAMKELLKTKDNETDYKPRKNKL